MWHLLRLTSRLTGFSCLSMLENESMMAYFQKKPQIHTQLCSEAQSSSYSHVNAFVLTFGLVPLNRMSTLLGCVWRWFECSWWSTIKHCLIDSRCKSGEDHPIKSKKKSTDYDPVQLWQTTVRPLNIRFRPSPILRVPSETPISASSRSQRRWKDSAYFAHVPVATLTARYLTCALTRAVVFPCANL